MSHLCITCTTSEQEVFFPTVKDYLAHEKGGHRLPPPEPIKPIEFLKTADRLSSNTPVPKKEPIILVYKFLGNCDCGSAIDTIEIKVDNSLIIVAYCINEKKQILFNKVIPINEQEKYAIQERTDESQQRKAFIKRNKKET